MFEKRKFFDYELAYNGYKRAMELFNKGGIEEIVNDKDFDISGGGIDYVGNIEQWASNGYIPINAFRFNITLYAIDRNFDTDKEENDTNSPVMSGLNKQKPGKKEEWVSEGQLTLFDM